jgi:hypothetical protein
LAQGRGGIHGRDSENFAAPGSHRPRCRGEIDSLALWIGTRESPVEPGKMDGLRDMAKDEE